MPYKNIHYKQLRVELAHDYRFTDECNDEQKALFLYLLLLAGVTENQIPNNEKYIKRVLNLAISEQKIRENLDKLLKTFPKLYSQDGFVKFKKFNKLHNYIGKSKGNPKESPGLAVSKERIERIIYAYIEAQDWDKNDYMGWGRDTKAIKTLLLKANDDKVIEGIKWISKQGYSWTLETLIRLWPAFMVNKDKGKMNVL